ncbi:RHS repeat-associated core domain-containing protein [Streptomyces sp. 2224.1]|uniref:RHS repeat domain-containing protein n=1 Tax=Streptomyces sp. 2224.1 TaxID=1881020 RepID=UPI00089667DE|nr:RHS repeat-associated core domain-containing protein [Streptomyces sp. 2224.1]
MLAYDELGRKTGTWQGSKTDANKLTAWTFDTLAKGQPDASIRYEGGAGGKAYTQKVTHYDSLYQATEQQLSLPEGDPLVKAGLPKNLSTTTGYRLDGTISQASQPTIAGLPAETVSYTYNATGQQLTAKGATGYLQGADYAPAGDLRRLTLGTNAGNSAKNAYIGYDYEPGTRRLVRSYVTDDTHPYRLQDLTFRQDDAGNVTSISDATNLGGTGKNDNQCFAYDGYRRLSEAWTPKADDCSAGGRTSTNLTGAAPYWTSYTYNSAGQRKQQVQHTTSGDTTTTYTYGTPNKQPHPLASTETNGKTRTYAYDKTGNTIQRPGVKANQTLQWNGEGKLSTTTEPAATGTPSTTDYLYDANGELLIRRAATGGVSILYFGDTEIRLTTRGTLSGLRYYTAAGRNIAVRTASGGASTKLTFLAADHHGTSSLAIDASTYSYTKRYTTPFGAPRGIAPTAWPDDKSFLGAPSDASTGLTHIGAREYDPDTGAFLSVDPLLEADKPQTLNGYSYSSNNPTTNSDPTGLGNADCMTGVMQHCTNGVPGSGSVYHPERERHSGCSVGCYSGGSSGTAYTSSSGRVTSGHWGSACNRFSCNKRWISGPRGDDKDWLGGILTGIVDTATVGCQVFQIFCSVDCAGDAMRQEMEESGVGLDTSAFSDGVGLGATFTPVPGASFFKTGELAVGAMLARRGKNIGPFQELPIPMQKRTVKKVAQRAGVGLDGVKVKINRDAELVGKMLYGHTAPNRTITLYPDAFSSAENLTKTIGHERQHVMQIDTYGPATSLAQEAAWERAAYASEGQFWNYYNGRLG